MTATEIADLIGPSCRDDARRVKLLRTGQHQVNGIDYAEYIGDRLWVRFLRADPPPPLDAARYAVHGGTRITGITVGTPEPDADDPTAVWIPVAPRGDFSRYLLSVDWRQAGGRWRFTPGTVDRLFSVAWINFRPGCEAAADCAPPAGGAGATPVSGIALDYLARDYASIRQLLLDLVARNNPRWLERSPADLGMALLELFAYEGDQLSYLQDAVANEAYLDTARQRISVKRHARLVDYAMRDGANARAYVHFEVSGKVTIPAGTVLLTRVDRPLSRPLHGIRPSAAPGVVVDPLAIEPDDFDTDPALAQARVFETVGDVTASPLCDVLTVHDWGNADCCLPVGTTVAHVYPAGAPLNTGDLLLLAEPDPARRQVVRITDLTTTTDPLHDGGSLALWEVRWDPADALTFALRVADAKAHGNIGEADHGRTVREDFAFDPPTEGARPPRLRLRHGPLTQPGGEPAITLDASSAGSGAHTSWEARATLLDSDEFDRRFVADVDNAGRAILRFGDGECGQAFAGIDAATVRYRVGNGTDGNLGADALTHVVGALPAVVRVTNPLPARGGADPETIEEVRQFAPAAFRSRQLRAVTEDDYRDAALEIPGVSGAVAGFRWTGSWHTVFVGIDPSDPADVRTDPRGRATLAPGLHRTVLAGLERRRLAGYDLEIRAATYVPLDVTIGVCARRGYFPGDVARAVTGAVVALFDPAYLTFGQPAHLSRVYAAVAAVPGVESATVTAFQRHGAAPAGELDTGMIPIGPWEIARLDNDPSNVERGIVTVTAGGGA